MFLYAGINTDILVSQEIQRILELLFLQKVFVLPRIFSFFFFSPNMPLTLSSLARQGKY